VKPDYLRRVALLEAKRRGLRGRAAALFADGMEVGWTTWKMPKGAPGAQSWYEGYRAARAERKRRLAEDRVAFELAT